MKEKVRAVHYINQFFGGIGGEEKADTGVQIKDGSLGPGTGLEKSAAGKVQVVKTIICGDNFFHSHKDEVLAQIVRLLREVSPDVLIAGPAFNAGRYGIACRDVAEYVVREPGIPSITAMFKENPALTLKPIGTFVLPSEDSVRGMGSILPALATFAYRLGNGEHIGAPDMEGYIPRGIRINMPVEKIAAVRAVAMLKEKLAGRVLTEVPLPLTDKVKPPAPIAELAKATIAFVTDGGLVPTGNPDRLESAMATKWFRYSMAGLAGLAGLVANRCESIHGGCDITFINQDPYRLIPLDIMYSLLAEGRVGKMEDGVYSTTGNATTIANSIRMGKEIAAALKTAGVDAVILTST